MGKGFAEEMGAARALQDLLGLIAPSRYLCSNIHSSPLACVTQDGLGLIVLYGLAQRRWDQNHRARATVGARKMECVFCHMDYVGDDCLILQECNSRGVKKRGRCQYEAQLNV